MVMVALESGNSSPLFKLLVEILGLPCKFNKSTWGKHVKKFKTAYESAANEVLLKSREKVCDQIPEDDQSGLTPKFLSFTFIVDISALRSDIKNLSVHSFLHQS